MASGRTLRLDRLAGRTLDTHLVAKRGQTGGIALPARGRRSAGQFRNLFKRQAAPNVGDNNLSLIELQNAECIARRLRIEPSLILRRREPECGFRGNATFVVLPPPFRTRLANRTVANGPIQPRDRIIWRLGLFGELDERLLDYIF